MTSLEGISQIARSLIWSHKRLQTTVFTHTAGFPETCKHTLKSKTYAVNSCFLFHLDSCFPKFLNAISLMHFIVKCLAVRFTLCYIRCRVLVDTTRVWPSGLNFRSGPIFFFCPYLGRGVLHGRIKTRDALWYFAVTAKDRQHAACCCKALLWNLLPPSEERGR